MMPSFAERRRLSMETDAKGDALSMALACGEGAPDGLQRMELLLGMMRAQSRAYARLRWRLMDSLLEEGERAQKISVEGEVRLRSQLVARLRPVW